MRVRNTHPDHPCRTDDAPEAALVDEAQGREYADKPEAFPTIMEESTNTVGKSDER